MKQLLKDIAEIGAGQGAPQGDNNYCENGIPFVKAGNLQELLEGKNINDIQNVSEEVATKHRLKLYSRGTIIFAKSGMSCMKGYIYVLPQDAYVVCHLACISPKESMSEYLRYYFLFHKPNQLVKDEAYPSISLCDIGNLEIDIKSISERNVIVNQLKYIENIIKQRQTELVMLDELIKARFLEMFGDPDKNEKNWHMNTFGDICSVRQGLQIPISRRLTHYEDDCYEYITVQYLHGGKNREYIKSPKKSVICNKNDILMTRTGNTGMVITNVEGVFHNNFFLIDFDRSRYNKDFLVHYLNLEIIQADIIRRAGVSTVPDLNHGDFYKIKVFEPPMDLQNKYIDFVNKVEKSKVVVQKSLDETQMLFDSLMQKYFG